MPPAVAAPVRVRFHYAEPARFGRITQVGLIRNSAGPASQRPFRVLDSFALVYSVDGAARYEDATGLRCDIAPGDVILVFPELPHMYGPVPGGRWSEFYLVFDGPVFDLWRSQGLLDPARPVFHCDPVDRWLPRLESVPDTPRRPSASLAEVCRLQQVLSAMLDASSSGGPDAGARRFLSRACALLESDLAREIHVPSLARELGTSYESFRKRFTAAMGTPPAKWRAARILERACELMQRGELSDKQIADRLGFCDAFHFSRKFKSVIGISPRQFRRTLSRTAPA
jgi:AraC-like DNA-binding protein